MKYIVVVFLSYYSLGFSQDVIVRKDGTSINAKVEEIGVDIIKYYKYDNLTGPIYSVKKSDIVIVNFENGAFELIETLKEEKKSLPLTIKETKELIIKNINNYSFVWKHDFDKYIASFEGNMLCLNIINQKGVKSKKNRYYDFSKVYLFDGISKRGGDKAVINIYIAYTLYNVNSNWGKNKLKIGIIGHDNGDKLWETFKNYNRLLLEKKEEN